MAVPRKQNRAETGTKAFTIRELAEEFSVSYRTLRFYEDRGLLAPRRVGVTRIYSEGDRARLRTILRGKALGFSLEEIGSMLAAGSSGADPDLNLSPQVVDAQIAHLERLLVELDEALATLHSMRESLAGWTAETQRRSAKGSD